MLPELQIHSPAWNLHWPLLALSARVHHLSSWTAKHTWVLPLQSHCLFSQSSVGTWVLLQTRQHIPELQEPFLTHLDPHNPYSTGLYEVLQWTLKILFQIKKILSVYKLSPLLQDFQLEDTLFSLPATLNFHFFPFNNSNKQRYGITFQVSYNAKIFMNIQGGACTPMRVCIYSEQGQL